MTNPKTTHEIYITLQGIQQSLSELRTDLKALTTTVVGGLDGDASMLMRLTIAERRLAQIEAKQVEDEALRQEFVALKNRVLGAAAVADGEVLNQLQPASATANDRDAKAMCIS